MSETGIIRILLVCLGNVCRSPMAHGVLLQKLADSGLADRVHVDSAGTGDHFVGRAADTRARMAAASRGYDLSQMRARRVEPVDFHLFDLILAADRENLSDLMALAPGPAERGKVRLLLEFATKASEDVPDPFQGDWPDFHLALDRIEEAADGLIAAIREGVWDRHASA